MTLEYICSEEIVPADVHIWENKVVRTIIGKEIVIPKKANSYRMKSRQIKFYFGDSSESKKINALPKDAEIILAGYHEVVVNDKTIYVQYENPYFFQKKDFNKLNSLRNHGLQKN
jgi:hypothetical protein